MKITKRQLKRIIREERAKLIREAKRRRLQEMSPADAGIAAAGGGSPADQGMAAARADDAAREKKSGKKPPVGQAKTRTVMQAGEKIWYALSTIVDQALDQSDPGSWRELADDLRGLADDVEDSIPE